MGLISCARDANALGCSRRLAFPLGDHGRWIASVLSTNRWLPTTIGEASPVCERSARSLLHAVHGQSPCQCFDLPSPGWSDSGFSSPTSCSWSAIVIALPLPRIRRRAPLLQRVRLPVAVAEGCGISKVAPCAYARVCAPRVIRDHPQPQPPVAARPRGTLGSVRRPSCRNLRRTAR